MQGLVGSVLQPFLSQGYLRVFSGISQVCLRPFLSQVHLRFNLSVFYSNLRALHFELDPKILVIKYILRHKSIDDDCQLVGKVRVCSKFLQGSGILQCHEMDDENIETKKQNVDYHVYVYLKHRRGNDQEEYKDMKCSSTLQALFSRILLFGFRNTEPKILPLVYL